MKNKYFFLVVGVMIVMSGLILLKFIKAHDEYLVWETRKDVLEEELKILKKEVSNHSAFLKKLRDDPRFQEDVVRRELGYATDEETTFRFSEE